MKNYFLAILLWLFSIVVYSDTEKDGSQYVLITAKPKSVKYLSSVESKGNDVNIGSHFNVKLKVIDTLIGQELSGDIQVKMTASHKGSIASKDVISVLLKNSFADEFKVLYWSVPRSIVCIPVELIEDNELSMGFQIIDESRKKICVNSTFYN